jgi:hypothetical protein
VTDLPDPTWRLLLSRGLPTFALEGVLPVLIFYAVLRASSLPAAIVASSVAGGAAVALQHRRGRDIALAAVTFVFIVVQATRAYRREFGLQSVVWGVYCIATAALRLGALLLGGVGGLVVVSLAAGAPAQIALVGWCLWHARRALSGDPGPRLPAPRRSLADGNEAQMSSSVRL